MDIDVPAQSALQPSCDPPSGYHLRSEHGHLITDLPTEIIQMIAKELLPTGSEKRSRHLNSLSQTCTRLRNVAYPMINRRIWFDEEIQYPDTMLSIVNYTFTDPLVEFVKVATFRLRAENGYWLKLADTDNEIIQTQLEELRGHLRRKAEEGIEVFQFFETQLEEYGIATLATILLYQLKELREIELSCAINAMSSRFMLTTLHHFDPPFQLERVATTRLVDLAMANYLLLERFLKLGISKVGIDSRFGSTNGAPKIRPEPLFSSQMDSDETPDSSEHGYEYSVSEGSTESEYKVSIPFRVRTEGTLARTIEQEIDQDYKGYEALDHRVAGYETGINYDPSRTGSDPENEDPLFIRDLLLWLDETPVDPYEPLIPLLQRAKGIRNLEVNLFPSVQFVSRSVELPNVAYSDCLTKILQGQIETLEALTIRISWLNAPQPNIPSLRGFENLRRVDLFYGKDTRDSYKARASAGESYFTFMFPRQLESLRVDIFKYNPFLDFVNDAIHVATQDFPNLKIILGIAKERIKDKMSRAVGEIWTSLPFFKDPVSGEWRSDIDRRPEDNCWRRCDMKHVPVQISAHGKRYRDVFCSDEGWNGPFQQHKTVDVPYSSRDSSNPPSSNESGTGDQEGRDLNAWETKSDQLEVVYLDA
ncbi:hypothetical protein TWF481_002113 [Arthrobotrys musiformis]|uniref:F-box domain-containing protein n=1 Tax=Arthrobotrys musiformis TaxID=47236 RepID=A0AAV9VSC7_9PEZI